MLFNHVWGLFAHPKEEWQEIFKEQCSIGRCYCTHVLILAAIPPISFFIGTTQVGWKITAGQTTKLTVLSAVKISIVSYITILVGILSIGAMIHWMAKTYEADSNLSRSVGLAAYTATPLLLVGIMGVYPLLWLDLLVGLPALAYTVYLLYLGVPIMMKVSEERGFLFSSAVLAVGLVALIAILAATIILWDIGFAPVYTD
jgi:hypothetical protein